MSTSFKFLVILNVLSVGLISLYVIVVRLDNSALQEKIADRDAKIKDLEEEVVSSLLMKGFAKSGEKECLEDWKKTRDTLVDCKLALKGDPKGLKFFKSQEHYRKTDELLDECFNAVLRHTSSGK